VLGYEGEALLKAKAAVIMGFSARIPPPVLRLGTVYYDKHIIAQVVYICQ